MGPGKVLSKHRTGKTGGRIPRPLNGPPLFQTTVYQLCERMSYERTGFAVAEKQSFLLLAAEEMEEALLLHSI